MHREFYLVKEGAVYTANANTPWDGETSVLCYAYNPAHALEIAQQYDEGKIESVNVWLRDENKAVGCLT